ncbi:MAG: hypothetical protein V3T44_05240, partial [bacterium]
RTARDRDEEEKERQTRSAPGKSGRRRIENGQKGQEPEREGMFSWDLHALGSGLVSLRAGRISGLSHFRIAWTTFIRIIDRVKVGFA